MLIITVLLTIIAIFLYVYAVPMCRYLYNRIKKKETYPLCYYFSNTSFDPQLSYDVGLTDVRTVYPKDLY